MAAEIEPAANASEIDQNGSRVLQNPPPFLETREGFATTMGPRDGVFVAKPQNPAETATFEQRLTAMIAIAKGGQVQELLAVAVREEDAVTIDVGGRPEALRPVDKQKVCLMLKMGFSRALAAAELGVHRSTITRTMARDEEFRRQVLEAEQLAERAPLLCVLEAAQKQWRAAAWLLKNNQSESVKRRKKRDEEREKSKATKRRWKETEEHIESFMNPKRTPEAPEPPRIVRKTVTRKKSE